MADNPRQELEELEELDALERKAAGSTIPDIQLRPPVPVAATTRVSPSIGRPEPKSELSQLSDIINQFAETPVRPGESLGRDLPSEFQTQAAVIENLLKEIIRLPKELISPVAEPFLAGEPVGTAEGAARTAEGLARFFPSAGRTLLNLFGAEIPTPPPIGEPITEEAFRAPTARETQEEVIARPGQIALAAVPFIPKLRAARVKPSAIEAQVVAASKAKAFRRDVPLAEVSKGVVKEQITKPSVLAEKPPSEILPIPDKAVKLQLPKEVVPKPEKVPPVKPTEAPVTLRKPLTPESVAKDLDITFNGLQERPKGKPPINTFTDKQTGSTFLVEDLSKVPEKLKQVRKSFERPTQDIVTEIPKGSEAKSLNVTEQQTNFVKPQEKANLYPLVKESKVSVSRDKNGVEVRRFKPATDEQLQSFAQASSEEFAGLTTKEKSVVRKEYSKQRRKQFNEKKLDDQNRLEFGIEPDPVLKKKVSEKPPEIELEGLKDINRFEKGLKDPDRIIEKTLPKKTATQILDKRDAAKAEYTEYVIEKDVQHVKDIQKDIGIKPGSALDKAVQTFGEGDLTLDQITKRFGSKGAEKIVKGAEWYRARYEELLKEYNQTMASVYPGDRSKIVSRRRNYFRHFRELGDMSKILDIVEEPGGLLNAPANVIRFLKPAGRKPGFIRRRLGRKTDVSASAGYSDYIHQAGYGIKINPMVNYMRQFSRQLEKKGLVKNEIPNFRDSFNTFVNGMAGVPDVVDAYMSNYLGKGWDVTQVINRRAKQNIILGNAGTVVAQFFNIPQAVADMGSLNFARGSGKSLAQIFMRSDLKGWRSDPMTKSPFMRERYLDSKFTKYKFGMVNNARSTAAWFMRTADEIAAKMMWNGYYQKAINENIKNPIRFADKKTRKMVAGRGIGELANLQRTKVFQVIAPFQVEVGNAMWAFIDLAKGERKFSKLATFTVASYLMNRVAENLRGTPVSFDPLQAMIEGFSVAVDERRKPGERIAAIPGRLAGEALSNIPLGQTAAVLYPKFGAKIPGTDIKLPTRKQVFGSNDPTRYGSSILTFDAIQDWPSRLLLPFGGIQVKKTITGIRALKEGKIKFGRKEIPLKRTDINILKAPLFGPFSTEEAQQFFDKRK